MRNALVCLAIWLCAASAVARDIHVNNLTGDDRRDGWPSRAYPGAGPVATISKALRLVEPGDRVVIDNTGEPYREAISLIGSRHSGTALGPFVIEGNGATIDGSIAIDPTQWEHVSGDVFAHRPKRMAFQQLFVDGHLADRVPCAAWGYILPKLHPLEWCLSGGKINFCVEPGKLPASYSIGCCALRTGVTLYYVHDVEIRSLIVQGFQVDGISVYDVVRDARLKNVTCRANGRSGVFVGNSAHAELDDCVLEDNGDNQLQTSNYAQVHLFDTKLSPDTAAAIVERGGTVWVNGRRTGSTEP